MGTYRATRHNGRSGKEGVFKAGHNDRTFAVENADHIETSRTCMNVYWDCYQGLNFADKEGNRPERKYNFDQVEQAFYMSKFGDSIDAQNERHVKSRHTERIRTVEQIRKDKKTCPEETIYQMGTKDGYEDYKLFTQVVAEVIQEIEKRYGDHIKVLDWSLHMDEATPHIHERHVFFADDGYGMLFPKQEKACEEMGFDLPYPDKKKGKFNNRKMSFDEEIRKIYIEIAEKHGVVIEKVPLEGKEHMEKNDFIIAKQNEEIAENQAKLDELILKISDIDALANEVAEKAYEKACEVVTETVRTETMKADVAVVESYRNEIIKPEHGGLENQRSFAKKILDNVVHLLKRKSMEIASVVKLALSNPEIKRRNQEEIAVATKSSIRERLAQAKVEAEIENANKRKVIKPIKRKEEIR